MQAHSRAMGQEDGEKWTAAAHLQPAISKSDSLLGGLPDQTNVKGVTAAVDTTGATFEIRRPGAFDSPRPLRS